MAREVSDLGGYDCQFESPPPDDLICLICTFVAREPHQLTCCGRVYCRQCLEELKARRYRSCQCPSCRGEGWEDFIDKRSLRHILALSVKCSNINNGCHWRGELKELDKHTAACDYRLVDCPNRCQDSRGAITKVLLKDINVHCKIECSLRFAQCKLCYKTGTYREISTNHLKECPEGVTECDNEGCHMQLRRCELDKHHSTCQHQIVKCDNEGCDEEVRRHELEDHYTTCQYELLTCVYSKCQVLLPRVLMPGHIRECTDKLYQHYSVRQPESQGSTVHKWRPYSHLVNQPQDSTPCGKLEFTITNFKQNNCEKFISPPFYTSSRGYKMCARVNISEDCEHLSVLIHLMPGAYDDEITWPMGYAVLQIELLSQQSRKKHYVNEKAKQLIFDMSSHSESIQRVRGWDRAETGFGYPEFIHLTQLKPSYLVKDTLCFRITVIEAPLSK